MKNPQILQSVAIILGIFTVFIIQNSFLSSYSSFLLAFIIIFSAIYISIKKRSKTGSELFTSSPIEIYGIISVILLIIVLTDGLASPLFFFLYFILFLLAFMAESVTIWVFLTAVIFFFVPEASNNFSSDTFIKLGSLLLIAPIAFFVAREFERREILTKRIQAKTDDIISEAESLKDNPSTTVAENEAIDEIIEEAKSLNEDSKN